MAIPPGWIDNIYQARIDAYWAKVVAHQRELSEQAERYKMKARSELQDRISCPDVAAQRIANGTKGGLSRAEMSRISERIRLGALQDEEIAKSVLDEIRSKRIPIGSPEFDYSGFDFYSHAAMCRAEVSRLLGRPADNIPYRPAFGPL